MMLTADLLFQLIHCRREELDRAPAPCANHVVMDPTVVLVLETRDAVRKGDLAGETALGQQLQCAVNRRDTYLRIFSLHQAVKLVGREMVAGFEKSSKDCVPLLGVLETDFLEVTMEDGLGLAHIVARDRLQIVDAFLDH